eukprot:TRINITY_DN5238_c0_g1_i1.p1 TRINITY_DN5238_c0_g1~~TRINITY_DN5238_c0_g1_i1.p1  ORF type:complete len:348 (-),score=82.65 TRINITY_DN5238_c0_g1_i1:169-1212(-)
MWKITNLTEIDEKLVDEKIKRYFEYYRCNCNEITMPFHLIIIDNKVALIDYRINLKMDEMNFLYIPKYPLINEITYETIECVSNEHFIRNDALQFYNSNLFLLFFHSQSIDNVIKIIFELIMGIYDEGNFCISSLNCFYNNKTNFMKLISKYFKASIGQNLSKDMYQTQFMNNQILLYSNVSKKGTFLFNSLNNSFFSIIFLNRIMKRKFNNYSTLLYSLLKGFELFFFRDLGVPLSNKIVVLEAFRHFYNYLCFGLEVDDILEVDFVEHYSFNVAYSTKVENFDINHVFFNEIFHLEIHSSMENTIAESTLKSTILFVFHFGNLNKESEPKLIQELISLLEYKLLF